MASLLSLFSLLLFVDQDNQMEPHDQRAQREPFPMRTHR